MIDPLPDVLNRLVHFEIARRGMQIGLSKLQEGLPGKSLREILQIPRAAAVLDAFEEQILEGVVDQMTHRPMGGADAVAISRFAEEIRVAMRREIDLALAAEAQPLVA